MANVLDFESGLRVVDLRHTRMAQAEFQTFPGLDVALRTAEVSTATWVEEESTRGCGGRRTSRSYRTSQRFHRSVGVEPTGRFWTRNSKARPYTMARVPMVLANVNAPHVLRALEKARAYVPHRGHVEIRWRRSRTLGARGQVPRTAAWLHGRQVREAAAPVEPPGGVRRSPTRSLQDLEPLDDPCSCTRHNVGAEDRKVCRTDTIWRQAAPCAARRSRTCKVRHKELVTAGTA
jgi:hypothetical protein